MAEENFIEKIASTLGQNASIKNVFGEPIHVGEKTIIPVARIAYGFGGGSGKSNKRQKKEETDATNQGEEEPFAKGSGGGGGFNATAKGIYEVTPTCTRFIPANASKQILLGIAVGYFLKKFFFSKRKK